MIVVRNIAGRVTGCSLGISADWVIVQAALFDPEQPHTYDETVLVHELGHALNLPHHRAKQNLMFPGVLAARGRPWHHTSGLADRRPARQSPCGAGCLELISTKPVRSGAVGVPLLQSDQSAAGSPGLWVPNVHS